LADKAQESGDSGVGQQIFFLASRPLFVNAWSNGQETNDRGRGAGVFGGRNEFRGDHHHRG
jgi:hypothetical protein